MAKSKEKKYIVGDAGYVAKGGKVYKTGEEISLTDEQFKNVEKLVVSAGSDEAEALAGAEDQKQEDADKKEK